MLYRIETDGDSGYLWIQYDFDQIQPIDNGVPFLGVAPGQVYGDAWEIMHLKFFDNYGGHKGIYPDISIQCEQLFLSLKAYNCLRKILAPHGEFLPILYELGDGYLFNPSTVLEPLKESIVYDEGNDRHYIEQCDFDNPPMIFVGSLNAYNLFIGDELYHAIKKHNLEGLDIYHNQYTYGIEPEGGYKGELGLKKFNENFEQVMEAKAKHKGGL